MRTYALAMAMIALSFSAVGADGTEGDAAKGEKVFAKCKACHEIATEKNKVGPTLRGIIGRKAGSVPGFKYSAAMIDSGVTWDATIIAEYVAKPKEFIPGNKMSFVGLKKAGDLQDLIAYITANCCS